MKKILIIILILSTALIIIKQAPNHSANAQVNSIGKTVAQTQSQATGTATVEQRIVDNLREKAKKQIENRINMLNRLIDKIDKDKKIQNANKTALTLSITEEENTLAALISRINQTTDAATIREIYNEMIVRKVYAYQIQKFGLLIIIDRLANLEMRLEDLTIRVAPLINKLSSEGKNVTELQKSLDDIISRLTDIKIMLDKDRNAINSTTKVSYKDTFVMARGDFAKIRANFAKIRADIAVLRGEFNNLKNTTAGPSRNPVSSSPATPTVGI